MKKVLVLLLTLAVLFALAGCSLFGPKEPDGKMDDTVDISLLWSALDGIWVSDDGQFAMVAYYEGDPIFSTGILNSSYGVGGPLSKASKTGDNTYTLIVDVPAVEATDEYGASEAYTREISIVTRLTEDPKKVDITDVSAGGPAITFTYRGKTF